MGREIRRVPKDWQHPKDGEGHYMPAHDEDYDTAAKEWIENCQQWIEGTHPDQEDPEIAVKYPYYWDWVGPPPDMDYYRPAFESEPTHYQIYENITEGTPVSPVFETEAEMLEWLIGQGHSEKAAKRFIEEGFAFSMVMRVDDEGTRVLASNIETYDIVD